MNIPFDPVDPLLRNGPKETLDKCAKMYKNVRPSFVIIAKLASINKGLVK